MTVDRPGELCLASKMKYLRHFLKFQKGRNANDIGFRLLPVTVTAPLDWLLHEGRAIRFAHHPTPGPATLPGTEWALEGLR